MVRDSVYKTALEEHNRYRRKHGVPEVTDDPALHREAQEWAEYLAKNNQFFHSTGRQKHMENLAGALGKTEEEAVRYAYKMWYDEIKCFNFNGGGFSMQTGHFTAMVWKTLKTIGIGISYNPHTKWWVVANKFGETVNMQGEFRQKVPRALSDSEFKRNEEQRMKEIQKQMENLSVGDSKKSDEEESQDEDSDSTDDGEAANNEKSEETPKKTEAKKNEPKRLEWVARQSGKLHDFVVKGGHDKTHNKDMYVARVQYGEGKIPGLIIKGNDNAHASYGGGEVSNSNYEILTAPKNSVKWVNTEEKEIDPNAVPGGKDPSGEVYFIGRTEHEGSVVCGKVHRGILFIAYAGKEVGFKDFEILVRS